MLLIQLIFEYLSNNISYKCNIKQCSGKLSGVGAVLIKFDPLHVGSKLNKWPYQL